jgi:hypothetical protein
MLSIMQDQATRDKKEDREKAKDRAKSNQDKTERPVDPDRRRNGRGAGKDNLGKRLERGAERGFSAAAGFSIFKALDDFIRLIVFPIAAILGAAVAGWVARGGGGILDGIKKSIDFFMTDILPPLQKFWDDTLVPAFKAISDYFTGTALPAMQKFFTETLVPLFKQYLEFMQTTWIPALKKFFDDFIVPFGKWIGETAALVSQGLWDGMKDMGPKLKEFYDKVLVPLWTEILSPLIEQVTKWAAVMAPIVQKMLAAGVTNLFDNLGAGIDAIVKWFGGLRMVVDAFKGMVANGVNWEDIQKGLEGNLRAFATLPELLIKVATNAAAWFAKVFGFDETAEALRDFAKNFDLVETIKKTFTKVKDWIVGGVTKIMETITKDLPNLTVDVLGKLTDYLKGMFSFDAFKVKLDEIANKFPLVGVISDLFTELGGWLKKIFDIDWSGLLRRTLPSAVSKLIFGSETPPSSAPAPANTNNRRAGSNEVTLPEITADVPPTRTPPSGNPPPRTPQGYDRTSEGAAASARRVADATSPTPQPTLRPGPRPTLEDGTPTLRPDEPSGRRAPQGMGNRTLQERTRAVFDHARQRGTLLSGTEQYNREVDMMNEERRRRQAAGTQGLGGGNTTVNNNVANNQSSTLIPVTPRNTDRSLSPRTDQNVNF